MLGGLLIAKETSKYYQMEEQSKLIQVKELVNHELKLALEFNRGLVAGLTSSCTELYQ
jgi:hypothetical protein